MNNVHGLDCEFHTFFLFNCFLQRTKPHCKTFWIWKNSAKMGSHIWELANATGMESRQMIGSQRSERQPKFGPPILARQGDEHKNVLSVQFFGPEHCHGFVTADQCFLYSQEDRIRCVGKMHLRIVSSATLDRKVCHLHLCQTQDAIGSS